MSGGVLRPPLQCLAHNLASVAVSFVSAGVCTRQAQLCGHEQHVNLPRPGGTLIASLSATSSQVCRDVCCCWASALTGPVLLPADRVENLRRQLNVNSNSSAQDMESIQTVELLGEGTFGKVCRSAALSWGGGVDWQTAPGIDTQAVAQGRGSTAAEGVWRWLPLSLGLPADICPSF